MSATAAPVRLLTIASAAERCAVDPSTVKRWIAEGRLESIKLGGVRRIHPDALDRMLAEAGGVELEERPAAPSLSRAPGDPVEAMAVLIGLSPRVAARRPELAERFEVVGAGEHFARFCRTFCRHTQEVPAGPELGSPLELEVEQAEFFAEALECDEDGRRIWKRVGLVEPRKNGKTTKAAAVSLYLGSPADGEHRPMIVQAAGSRNQAGELYGHTRAFVDDPLYGSDGLRALFVPQQSAILCPAIAGSIIRVAGDGDLNHSLNPHGVVADELHVWRTPKQRENWKALTTAQGARVDPFVLFITTEGEGDDNVLAELLKRVDESPDTEVELRRPGLTIYRNRPAGVLIWRYAVPDPELVTLGDVDAFKLANPASWRTPERLAADLADPMIDDPTKLRLYGNVRAQRRARWIRDERWAEALEAELEPERELGGDRELELDDRELYVGLDGAITHDTTAVGWAWALGDGRVAVRARVWSVRPDVPYHVFVPGGRLDNEDAEEFVLDALARGSVVREVAYDPRYMETEAKHLDRAGLTVADLPQSSPAWWNALGRWYDALEAGTVVHDGDPVLTAHVRAAAGRRTDRGWKVSKLDSGAPIDALIAVVMAHYRCVADESVAPWVGGW